MSAILFTFPGSPTEGAPNGGRGFNVTIDPVPDGMRSPCVGEEVSLREPHGEQCSFRVHVVEHYYQGEFDSSGPYTYVVLRYG